MVWSGRLIDVVVCSCLIFLLVCVGVFVSVLVVIGLRFVVW